MSLSARDSRWRIAATGALVVVSLGWAGFAAASVCEAPEKIGVEHRLSQGGRRASITWTGSGYGIAWVEGDAGSLEGTDLVFARLDSEGVPVEESTVLVVDDLWSTRPALVWDGNGYGLAWTVGFRNSGVGPRLLFARLDADGRMFGLEVEIANVLPENIRSDPDFVWTGTGYAVAWDNTTVTPVRLTHLDAAGNLEGEEVFRPVGVVESLVWNGSEYSIVLRYRSRYEILRIDGTGNPVGAVPSLIGEGPHPPYSGSAHPILRHAAHLWNGSGYGVVMSYCEEFPDRCDLVFAVLDAEGAVIATTPISPATGDVNVALAWTGSEYGVLWQIQDGPGTWLARISALGRKLGPDYRVTGGSSWQTGPRLVWTGSEYGVTVEPMGGVAGDSIWFARVGCNCTEEDGDGISTCQGDCDDGNAATYPGAIEVNDGADNQCPGEVGHGLVDENDADSGFAADAATYVWAAQPGATSYQVARADDATLTTGCVAFVTEEPVLVDAQVPQPGGLFHYLNRALTPHAGSWGQNSAGFERAPGCS